MPLPLTLAATDALVVGFVAVGRLRFLFAAPLRAAEADAELEEDGRTIFEDTLALVVIEASINRGYGTIGGWDTVEIKW